jgi:hypothetical protein
MNPDEYFRFWLHSHRPDCNTYVNGDDMPLDVICARLRREGASQSGIAKRIHLRLLEAQAVNQGFLEELTKLPALEYLALEHPVTANDLAPLSALGELRILKINSPKNIVDFKPILALPKLERLFIQNAKNMADIEWIRPMRDRLRVLGIEGSMYTAQRIPTLSPLEHFDLEAIFMTNTKLIDKSFASLRAMTSLKYFSTARNVPRAEFEALHAALPNLHCDWFQSVMWTNMTEIVSGRVRVPDFDLRLPESKLRLPLRS